MGKENAVAVVGMACRYPGAGDSRRYWAALRAGVEGITHFTREDLVAAGADPQYVRRANFVPAKGVLADSGHFDWSFFGYSRAEAASIDPQQRVFLECASAAVDDAGIDPTRFPGWIGVYAGSDRTNPHAGADLSPLARLIGHEKDFVATRVAYKLGLRGPAVTVQTACSTSLTAVHMAAVSLLGRECDVALAGGVAVSPRGEWGYLYEEGGPLSPDGHCRPFDEQAAGTVPSEGVGVVVLKRMEDALRDGDRIAAVILGSALNNDGGEKMGYTAPSIPGQSDVIRYAQKIAEVDPVDIDYVECHGTATPMGDPVEVAALTDAFRMSTDAVGATWLGAVKSNIGHTSAAAGVAAFIKTVLMLEHRELVPTLHYSRPNPLLDIESTPFKVCTETQPWPDRGTPMAAVSSFGVGGTNAHVILQGPPRRERPVSRPGARVLAVSAASADALGRMRQDLSERLRSDTDLALPEVARTLAERRVFRHRQAFVAGDRQEAADLLLNARDSEPRPLGRVAFLFPGHGTLRYPAGAPAYRLLPGFRTYFDEIRDAIQDRYALDLSPVVTEAVESTDWFDNGSLQQLGLFAIGYALGRQLGDWGVKPAAMLGNSVGEFAPATLAGVWSPADAASLVYERAQAIWDIEPGRMVAVDAPAEEVARRIPSAGGVAVSVISRGGVVLSGPEAEIDELLAGDALHGLDVRPLNVERAGHCAMLAPAAERLREAVASTPSQAPGLRLISNVTGDWADPDAVRGPDYWAEQVRRPVLLDGGMSTLLGSGCDTFIELGPGSSMLGTLRWNGDWDTGHTTMPMLGRAEDGELGLLRALGTLWERGVDVLEDTVPGVAERPFRCSLPGHPFAAQDPEVDQAPRTEMPKSERRASIVVDRHSVRPVLEQLWCRTLGVPSVADGDNFYALGGESLMAVNLMSQLREHAEIAVSVAEFSKAPTFGRLVELAEQGRSTDVRPAVGVVTLREGGGRPLFLAADAAGTALSYQVLADLLDGQRPVHGLEPDGIAAKGMSVEDIAAHHVDALHSVQPSGPYTIGGWSFGAVVAHEMARQLTARGERVDMLVCLDAFVPGRRGRPIGSDPEFVLSHRYLQISAALGIGLVGRQVRRNPGLRQLLADKFHVLSRYRPQPVACPAVVFKVRVDGRKADRLRRRLSALYDGGVRVHPVDGDHWSVLTEPHVRDLAEKLREALGADPTVVTGEIEASDVH